MVKTTAVILAAGKGTRMKSELPKVLHQVNGFPMIEHVVRAAKEAGADKPVVVIGHGGESVKQHLGDTVLYAWQKEQLGTGHAVMQTKEILKNFQGNVLILCGDTPLVTPETLKALVDCHQKSGAHATVLTAILEDPAGYGRIVRNGQGSIEKIVEQKDASGEELAIREINTGAYCMDCAGMFKALEQIGTANAQGEYYLTDVLEIFARDGNLVEGLIIKDPQEMMGINNRVQLAEAEKAMRMRTLQGLMESGVTVIDPDNTYIQSGVDIGPDTVIYPQTYIEGRSIIGSNCVIGPAARIVNSVIGEDVQIQYSVVLESRLGSGTAVGPFAYIRPGTEIGRNAKIGDFVEIKKSKIGDGSKVPHLSYIGDSQIGEKVNIGAGTITCNYDGKNKWPTVIADGVFVGSNTNLVAPVNVGKDAVIAAGSTITKDIPEGALAVARSKQTNFAGWAKRKK